jgi:capsular exopolysaccharide synthesis family protein
VASAIETPEADAQDVTTRTGLSLLQVMWTRKSLVVLGIMLGMVLGLLYFAQKQRTYQSTAQIQIVKKTPDPIMESNSRTDSRMSFMEDYMSTQQSVIRSRRIISDALKLPELKECKTFPSENLFERLDDFQKALSVLKDSRDSSPGAQSNILNLTFAGPVVDDCQKILAGIISSYQNYLDNLYKQGSEKTVEQIEQAKNLLMVDLKSNEEKYNRLLRQSPLPLVRTEKGMISSAISERLAKYESQRLQLKMKQVEFSDHLAQVESAFKEGGNKAGMRVVKALGIQIKPFEGVNDMQKTLTQLKMGRVQLLNTLGAKHPRIKEVDDQIAELETAMGIRTPANGAKPVAKANGDDEDLNPDNAESYIKMLRVMIIDLDKQIGTFTALFEAESKNARDMTTYESELEAARNHKEMTTQMLDGIIKNLQRVEATRNFGGYSAEQIGPASPAKQIAPNALTVFPLAGIGGLVAGLCLAYLAEMSDKSFRTPAEIRRRLGLPVMAHIPYYVPDEKAAKLIASGEPVVDPMLCAHYRSNAIESEAFRSVRTALYFNTHGVGHQVIQVTSPGVSEGKSTLAANLAVSIAQSGKRTIIIDGDCRRPRIHKIFSIPADTGLATVIMGQTDLMSAVRPTAIPNLSVLPCGPRPVNPAELLTSPRFKELLDVIRSQYEFVIIDTPPLTVVTDPCVVAPRVDGVILTIKIQKNGRPFAERAKEILTSLGANVLGVVVNGVGSPNHGKYGYGYDQYGYGYGYSYRYSYTYADEYSDDKAASYYNTDPAGESTPAAPAEGQ